VQRAPLLPINTINDSKPVVPVKRPLKAAVFTKPAKKKTTGVDEQRGIANYFAPKQA
jgi:hypothetical protein